MSDAGRETTRHERHVAQGYCPAISSTKAWCNHLARHDGPHMAPYLHSNGTTTPLHWTDADRWPSPPAWLATP